MAGNSVGNLIFQLSTDMAQFMTDMNKASERVTGMQATTNKQLAKMNKAWDSLKRQAGLAIASIASVATVKAIVSTTLKFDSMRLSLESVTGSSEAAAIEFGFVRDVANKLGLDIIKTGQAYVGLAASSKGTALQGEATRKIFVAIAKASTALGLSADQTQGALLAISQMMSKGTVQAEELRGQLGERLYGAFQLAAKASGTTTMELGNMLKQGKVLTDDFLPNFANEVEKSLGQGSEKASKSARAAFQRFKNSVAELEDTIGRSGIVDWLASVAQGTSKLINIFITSGPRKEIANLEDELAGLNKKLESYQHGFASLFATSIDVEATKQRIVEVKGKIEELKKKIEEANKSPIKVITKEQPKDVAAYVKELSKAEAQTRANYTELEKTSDEILRINGLWQGGLLTTEEYSAKIQEIPALHKDITAANNDYIKSLSKSEQLIRNHYSPLDEMNDEVLRLNALWQGGVINVDEYGRRIQEANNKLEQTKAQQEDIVGAWEAFGMVFGGKVFGGDIMNMLTESGKHMANVMQLAGATAGDMVSGMISMIMQTEPVQKAMEALNKAIQPIIELLGKMLAPVINAVTEALKPVLEALIPIIKAFQPVFDAITKIIKDNQPLFVDLGKIIKNLAPLIAIVVKQMTLFTPVISAVTNALRLFYNPIKVLTSLFGFLKDVGNALYDVFKSLKGWIYALEPAFLAFAVALRLIRDTVSLLEKAFNLIKKPIEQIFGAFSALQPAVDGIVGVFRSIWDPLVNARNAISWIASPARSVYEAFKALYEPLKKLVDFLKNAIKGTSNAVSSVGVGGGSTPVDFVGNLFAKGAPFSHGNVIPFANGTLVDQPTVFPMASGNIGLMGERGTEAIMPLKRMGSGDLGVTLEYGPLQDLPAITQAGFRGVITEFRRGFTSMTEELKAHRHATEEAIA